MRRRYHNWASRRWGTTLRSQVVDAGPGSLPLTLTNRVPSGAGGILKLTRPHAGLEAGAFARPRQGKCSQGGGHRRCETAIPFSAPGWPVLPPIACPRTSFSPHLTSDMRR